MVLIRTCFSQTSPGSSFVVLGRKAFLSLVKLPCIIKIHSATTCPNGAFRIQVRPGVITGCPLVYSGSTSSVQCPLPSRGVRALFFIPQPPLRNSAICNHHLFSSGASRDGCRTGVPFKSNPERTRLKNYDLANDHI